MAEHARPARYASEWFDQFIGDVDPALRTQLAHDTADALLARVRTTPSSAETEQVLSRIQALAREDGIDTVAELWSQARAHTLPGALWRVYLVHTMVVQRADETAVLYSGGAHVLHTTAPVVAGAAVPTGPEQVRDLSDAILKGVFSGDFATALDRAAAFCRVVAAGCLSTADETDALGDDRASALTRKASRLVQIADDLARCAVLWRADALV